jgi:general secretion pathway protein K
MRSTPAVRRSSAGFIVVTVLWILAALATLAAIYAVYLNVTAVGLVEYDDRLQAQELAVAGVELAVFQITANPKDQPARGQFDFRLGNASIAVEFRSENGRVDLNFAPKELLTRLFMASGAERANAERYADRIIGWRTPRGTARSDEEASLYREAGRPYGPRGGPFQHISEVGLIVGVPPGMIDSALPNLTVYSGQPEINALSASADVLAALPGLTSERIQTLLSQRATVSQDIVNAQLGVAAQFVTFLPGRANRILVTVPMANRRLRVEAIVLVQYEAAEPFRVLSWSERID